MQFFKKLVALFKEFLMLLEFVRRIFIDLIPICKIVVVICYFHNWCAKINTFVSDRFKILWDL